jgi:hypothetical protein
VSGLAPELKFIAEGMIRGSMGLIESMRGARDTAIALGHELARQHGMAGDDDAGRAFAKVYVSAASATLNQMGFSSYVLGETSRGLMRTAREFMSQESKVVSALLGRQVDLTVGMGDPGADCTENYLGLGRELPEVVGETAWHDKYAPSGRSDRFRGSQEKIRDVAGSWRQAGSLMQRFLEDAQTYSGTAGKAHSGEAADAFRAYVKHFVGLTCPPAKAEVDEPLVTNLVAACSQLAKACDRYADHVEAAKEKIQQHHNDLFAVDMPWDQPMFGASGYDGGLHDAVLSDPWIQDLGNDSSRPARSAVPAAAHPCAHTRADQACTLHRDASDAAAHRQSRRPGRTLRRPHSARTRYQPSAQRRGTAAVPLLGKLAHTGRTGRRRRSTQPGQRLPTARRRLPPNVRSRWRAETVG